MNMIALISTNNGRGFRIRGTKIEAGPHPKYLCTGKVPDSIKARALQVSGQDIERVKRAVEASAPLNFEVLDEAVLAKSAGDALGAARARIAELDRDLGKARARITELEKELAGSKAKK